jgi:hypothetical protein
MEATPMKLVGAISTAVLALTLGAAVPAYAQEEQRDKQEEPKAKPAQQDEKKSQPDRSAKQEEKTPPQDKNAKPEEKTAPQDKNARQQENTSQANEKNSKQEGKTRPQQQPPTEDAKPERQAQHTGGNGGGRIPDDRFKANFGQQHTFRVSQADNSSHRFQYGGYSFGFVDAWPSNWLYTQDVFVVDIDGVYYLCNPMYPGVNIALSVTL